MPVPNTVESGLTLGQQARRLRIASLLTQQKLAFLAGVPRAHIDLLERSFPVPLDSKRKIMKLLWSQKTEK
jgi:transcriptional regulator with XRE-family HTH domain